MRVLGVMGRFHTAAVEETAAPAPGMVRDEPARPETGPQVRQRNWPLVMCAILVLGMGLRAAQYLSQQSYWNDEAALVLNIYNKTASELMGPLDHGQASPPLFLLLMRGMHVMLGRSEIAMRLAPLLLSFGALITFAYLVRMLLPPAIAAITLVLFSLSDHLIAHAAEVKQYSGDVMVAALLLLVALRCADRIDAGRRLMRVAMLGTVALWFSHPTVFMFGGIALALLPAALRQPDRSLARIALSLLAPVASFVALYAISIRQQEVAMLFDYWQAKFVDFSRPHLLPWWLFRSLLSLFNYACDNAGAVLLPLGALGAIHLWREKQRQLLGMLVLPMLLTLLAAAMRRYPFSGTRLTVFLAPSCLLLAAVGLEVASRELGSRSKALWTALVAILIGLAAAMPAYHLLVPRHRGNMRPVVQYIREHRQPHEHVYVSRDLEFLCYWPNLDERIHRRNWPGEPPRGRFWVAVSYSRGKQLSEELPEEASQWGDPVDRFEVNGGAAHLYARD